MLSDIILVIIVCAVVAGALTVLYGVFEWAKFAAWVAYDKYMRERGKQPKRG